MAFELRFPKEDVEKWAAQYDYPGEPELIAGPVARARKRGYPEYSEFLEICAWKSAATKVGTLQTNPNSLMRLYVSL